MTTLKTRYILIITIWLFVGLLWSLENIILLDGDQIAVSGVINGEDDSVGTLTSTRVRVFRPLKNITVLSPYKYAIGLLMFTPLTYSALKSRKTGQW